MIPAKPERKATRVIPARKVPKATRATRVIPALKANRVSKAPLVRKA